MSISFEKFGPAIGYASAGAERAETILYATQILSRVLDEQVALHQVGGLAGPNDVFQVLLKNAGWVALAFTLQGFLGGVLSEAGADAYNKMKELLPAPPAAISPYAASDVTTFYKLVEKASEQGLHIVFGLYVAPKEGEQTPFQGRNIGIELGELSPLTFARAIAVLSRISADIEATLANEPHTLSQGDGHNSDMSGAIRVAPDNSAIFTYRRMSDDLRTSELITLSYDSTGKRID